MKKIIWRLLLLSSLCLLLAVPALAMDEAAVQKEMSIGCVALGDTVAHVEAVYGKPKVYNEGPKIIYLSYNDLYEILAVRDKEQGTYVVSVGAKANSLMTPGGLHTDMPFSLAQSRLGTPTNVVQADQELVKTKNEGFTATYVLGRRHLRFVVDHTGFIREIWINHCVAGDPRWN